MSGVPPINHCTSLINLASENKKVKSPLFCDEPHPKLAVLSSKIKKKKKIWQLLQLFGVSSVRKGFFDHCDKLHPILSSQDFFYSRKKFQKPELQPKIHQNFEDEVRSLL